MLDILVIAICAVICGAENFVILRHIALNLLKQETTLKVGIKAKRKAAGWDPAYLLRLLAPLLH